MSRVLSCFYRHYRPPWYSLHSMRGRTNRSFLLWIGLAILILSTYSYLFFNNSTEPSAAGKAPAGNMCATSLTENRDTISEIGQSPKDEGAGDVLQRIQQVMEVDRVHHSGDEQRIERSIARKDFSRVKRLMRELKQQGLRGEALYAAAKEQLTAAHGPGALKMLDGYRRLEEDLDREDLDSMTPEERFEYLHQARQAAFGVEIANMLFFKDEARDRYYLDEWTLRDDPYLSEEVKAERIHALRKQLKVDLALQGSSIQFADERLQELEEKLRARFGERVETMTPEERDQAIWDLYSEELPPEIMERIKTVKIRLAKETYGNQKIISEEHDID